MKNLQCKPAVLLFVFSFLSFVPQAQEAYKGWLIGGLVGFTNYQGDLQPNSFSYEHTKPGGIIWLRKPLTNRLSVKGGVLFTQLEAADKFNRDYLQPRNLSFYSSVKEAFLHLDFTLFNLSHTRISPYGYGGLVLFHFNPYTYDTKGEKVYLQPLSTEGQGLPDYPDRKKYKLTQPALAFGGGLRVAVNKNLLIAIETGQRKSFIDYIDDVSTSYVDGEKLFTAKGAKAVELAFRGDEWHSGTPYPADGEQRGTQTEMDWYYYAGLSLEVKLNSLTRQFSSSFSKRNSWYSQRCPKFF